MSALTASRTGVQLPSPPNREATPNLNLYAIRVYSTAAEMRLLRIDRHSAYPLFVYRCKRPPNNRQGHHIEPCIRLSVRDVPFVTVDDLSLGELPISSAN